MVLQRRNHFVEWCISIPPDRVSELAPVLLLDKQQEIVVYCANLACHASGGVARKLTAMGYRNVGHYAGGKAEWTAAGFLLERS